MTRFPRCDNPVLLVLNPGSSSIKWSVHNAAVLESQNATESVVAGQTRIDHSNARTHFEAAELLTRVLESHDVRAVIVRVVHGGSEYLKESLNN